MRIQNNMMALNTYRQYNIANNQTAGYAEKLSSGYQINRAGDDAAGLAISEKMRAQIRGLNMASKNSLDAVSLIQTAEGALQSTHDILQRMRELAVQAASDTNEQVIDRGALDQEFQALKDEIDDTARTTRFNDQNLIDGTFQKAFYSTDITRSMLTDQTVADVNRVGVKSNHNMDGIYNIKVQYIEAKDTVYARASEVSFTEVADNKRVLLNGTANGTGTDVNSIIHSIEFTAVSGSEHNGKTFTISASGEGNDLFATNDGLYVKITDGDTDYVGKVTSNIGLESGSEITVNFDGVGEMKITLIDDVNSNNGDVFNIASMLNSKEFKFVKAAEVLDTTSGLARTNDISATPYAVSTDTGSSSGINTVTAEPTVHVNGGYSLAGVTAVNWTTFTTGQANTGSFSVTINGELVQGSITATLGAAYTNNATAISINLGAKYGTFTLGNVAATGTTSDDLKANLLTALQGVSIVTQEAGYQNYAIDAGFAAAAGNAYANTNIDASAVTVGVGTDGVVTLAGNFTVTDLENNTFTIDSTTATTTLSRASDLTSSQRMTIEIDGLGTFSFDIGASLGRTNTDLEAALETALQGISLDLGDAVEGQDTVKGSPAQIALSLKGEVVVVGQNDTKAAFDSSGLSLSFRPLDFSGITDTVSATAQFTNSGSKDTIAVNVVENDGKALTIQSGANQGDELDINIDAMDLQMLGLTNSSIATQKSASRAITEVNNAINQVSTQRAALGALQNRLNFKIANLDTSAENLQAAESRIRDTDMAKVMTAFTKSNILGQAATAMLAQANSQPQNVLQLLR